VSADALIDFVASSVAPYKRIRAVEFIDALPRSPAGKLLRRVLVERDRASTQA
jgi:acyl-CoA synthetase (AMP-forming)/AMP-acid ligase II